MRGRLAEQYRTWLEKGSSGALYWYRPPSNLRFALSSVCKQTVLNKLVHSHNFWSFSSTSENHTIDEQETTRERKGDDANAKTRLAFSIRPLRQRDPHLSFRPRRRSRDSCRNEPGSRNGGRGLRPSCFVALLLHMATAQPSDRGRCGSSQPPESFTSVLLTLH
jgi:hypothetical protein